MMSGLAAVAAYLAARTALRLDQINVERQRIAIANKVNYLCFAIDQELNWYNTNLREVWDAISAARSIRGSGGFEELERCLRRIQVPLLEEYLDTMLAYDEDVGRLAARTVASAARMRNIDIHATIRWCEGWDKGIEAIKHWTDNAMKAGFLLQVKLMEMPYYFERSNELFSEGIASD
jgi:hypothetical protein